MFVPQDEEYWRKLGLITQQRILKGLFILLSFELHFEKTGIIRKLKY